MITGAVMIIVLGVNSMVPPPTTTKLYFPSYEDCKHALPSIEVSGPHRAFCVDRVIVPNVEIEK